MSLDPQKMSEASKLLTEATKKLLEAGVVETSSVVERVREANGRVLLWIDTLS